MWALARAGSTFLRAEFPERPGSAVAVAQDGALLGDMWQPLWMQTGRGIRFPGLGTGLRYPVSASRQARAPRDVPLLRFQGACALDFGLTSPGSGRYHARRY